MTDNRSKDSIDYVFQTHTSPAKDRLCLFFDDAVIRITIKERSPSMGHISRTVWTWIDCWIYRIWILEFISNTSTHLNKYLTFWPKMITADTLGQSHHTAHAHQELFISLTSLVPNSVKMSECLASIMRQCVVQMCVYMCTVFFVSVQMKRDTGRQKNYHNIPSH